MNNRSGQVVIAGPRRTPVGAFGGTLSSVPAPRLGARVVEAALDAAGVSKEDVDEVIMGNVLSAGLGQAPARQAALFAGLPDSTQSLTINKMCGSGLKAVMLASQAIQSGDARVVVAGGMESMSRAPYLVPKARSGLRLGHGEIQDSMILDGLWDVYTDKHMGSCAETCARDYSFSREDQDAFAMESYRRARKAQQEGLLAEQIVPVEVTGKDGKVTLVTEDEEPHRSDFEKMKRLTPAFESGGTVTAANASKLNDAAAAMVVLSEERARDLGVTPLARLIAQSSHAQDSEWFTTAPVGAIRNVLKKAGMTLDDIDLFEINEAFSAVGLAVMKDLGLSHDVVNVHGGAVALGHPIGASGARILVTLLHALKTRGAHRGIAAICIGGGEASAVIVERV